MSEKKPFRDYGKRSVRFWVTLYFVGGTVIYVLAYLLFSHPSSAGTASPSFGH